MTEEQARKDSQARLLGKVVVHVYVGDPLGYLEGYADQKCKYCGAHPMRGSTGTSVSGGVYMMASEYRTWGLWVPEAVEDLASYPYPTDVFTETVRCDDL